MLLHSIEDVLSFLLGSIIINNPYKKLLKQPL